MIQITHNKISFSTIILIGSGALTLIMVLWLLNYCYYGIDLTDESFYLNWIANPWIYKYSISQFGFIYHPLHIFTNGNIAEIRQINLLITFLLSWVLFYIFFKTALTNTDKSTHLSSISIIIIAASLATSGFIYYCPFAWLSTPSYNSLTLQGLLSASIGALLTEKTTLKYSLVGWILIALAGWLVFMAKPSSAAALFFAMGVYFIITGKLSIKLLSICLLTTITFFLISAYLIDGSVVMFIKRYIHGFANMKLLGLNNMPFRLDKFIFKPEERKYILIGTVILSVIAYFKISNKKHTIAISNAITIIFLLIGFLSIFNMLPLFITKHHFFAMQVVIIPLSAIVLTLALLGKDLFSKIKRNQWFLVLFFLVLPYVFAFGTTNNYALQSQLASCFWILSGLAILTPAIINTSKWPVLIILAVATQLITIFLLQQAMDLPYRQNQPLRAMHHRTIIEATNSSLILNKQYSTFFQYLQRKVKNLGFLPKTPLIDLSGQSPGLIYIMNGKAIGQAWAMGGYPGSNKLALANLSDNVSCNEIVDAWILIEPQSPISISPSILKDFGITLEKDYTLAAEITMPVTQRKFQLLKPYRTKQEALMSCKNVEMKKSATT